MNILFVHQDFPGQYAHIIRQISTIPTIKAIGSDNQPSFQLPKGFSYFQYPVQRTNTPEIHPCDSKQKVKLFEENFAHELHTS